jgi:hypothetical protein
MLKLELFRHREHIHMRYVRRTSLFSPTFLKAFAIALALHAAAFLLFSINDSSVSEDMLSLPVEVEMDPNIHFGYASRTMTRIDPHGLLTYAPAKPGHSRAAQPSLPGRGRKVSPAATKGVSLADIPLRSIEKSLYKNATVPTRIRLARAIALEGLKQVLFIQEGD